MSENIVDISSGVVQLVVAVMLVAVKIPGGKHWAAIRRMNWLLFACYVCVGLSNLLTGSLGVAADDGPVQSLAMVVVSMYQAMLFTGTCVTFVSPRRANVKWLSVNAFAITAVCVVAVAVFCQLADSAWWVCTALCCVYTAQLVVYCLMYRRACGETRRRLEASYDEDMSASLRWITRCFLGALTVGVSALVFAVFHFGSAAYMAFTGIYTVYYVYVVICVINYRISAGFIVKVVAASEEATESTAPVADDMDHEAELRLEAALRKWVDEKRFVQNDQTMEEIARELDTTHALLKWYFTNRLRTTFRTWRLELRVAEAKRLLADADTPPAMVHKLVGVADKSNFHKLFRKQVGMTPREYRNEALQGGEPGTD